MVEAILANTPLYLMIIARLAGMIGMNPLLARKNVPSSVRVALIMLMTVLLAPTVQPQGVLSAGSLELAEGMLRELFVGYVCGFVFQIYYYMIFFAGDLMDTEFGLAMAKVFDPGTNIQMSASGNLLNLLFVLYLFATNSHLLMIRIFATSFEIIPIGGIHFSPDTAQFILQLFGSAFSLGLRLAAPFIAAEFIVEVAMGVLMKLIPQIHVFVLNIQLKLLLGLVLLLAFAGPIGTFIDNYQKLMFEMMEKALYAMA